MPDLGLSIPGRPPTQGSLRVFRASAGRPVVTHDRATELALYRARVGLIVRDAMGEHPPIEGPVTVAAVFLFTRPQLHHVGRDPRREVRPEYLDAYPRGDVDKLERALLDALTAARAWRDDGQVTRIEGRKVYGPIAETLVRLSWRAE